METFGSYSLAEGQRNTGWPYAEKRLVLGEGEFFGKSVQSAPPCTLHHSSSAMAEWVPDPNGVAQVLELAKLARDPARRQEVIEVRGI